MKYILKKSFVILFATVSIFLFLGPVGCQTKPKAFDKAKGAQWSAKALIKNQKTNESQVLDLDILAIHPMPVRIEVSTSLGIHLASLVIKKDTVQILVPKQKKYYEGESSAKALFPLLKVNVDPKILSSAIYQESFDGWNCQADNGELVSCVTNLGDQISWSKIDSDKKLVTIRGDGFELQINFKNFQQRPELNESHFRLIPDPDFKVHKLK